jgi:serine/threonine-protein kinase
MRSIQHFQKAIETDPNYALAHAGLAEAYHVLAASGWVSGDEAWPKVRPSAMKALEIDDTLAEAHLILADLKLMRDWDWEGAEEGFRRALELNPGHAATHTWYSWYLTAMGRHDEALKEATRAQDLDPLSPFIRLGVGSVLYDLGRFEKAAELAEDVISSDPDFDMAYRLLGLSYIELKRFDEAIGAFNRAGDTSGHGAQSFRQGVALAHALAGRTEDAERELRDLTEDYAAGRVLAHHIAWVYIALGRIDEAFEWLERAYVKRVGPLVRIRAERRYDSLRSDPRFADLLRRMRLEW